MAFDRARTAVVVCAAVDGGDIESLATLLEGGDRRRWIGLAEQALVLLRQALQEIAVLSNRPCAAVYDEWFGRLLRDEAHGGRPGNLVLSALRCRFTL